MTSISPAYEHVRARLQSAPRTWLVTGSAGFIGSNLAEALLRMGQRVVGIDDFSNGFQHNVDDVRRQVGEEASERYRFFEADVRNPGDCAEACRGVDVILHQAALGSVPRSIANPVASHLANADGTLNLMDAARDAGVRRFVYASSSSTYGDNPALPKVEHQTGRPLSPYAVSKYVGELYGGVFHRVYGLETVGLRYFNVFGRRQRPDGPYAAVIPRWIGRLLSGEACVIHGDGGTSRDFCYIENVVQANVLAGTTDNPEAFGEVYNVACGHSTSLNELFGFIRDGLRELRPGTDYPDPEYTPPREGDIRDSLADLAKVRARLGYEPTHHVADGLREALRWYVEWHESAAAGAAPRT
jgi:UDP-N-acetylglucosamine/UDP-N-acetylgalactosamine 4-epimerase